MQGNIDELSRAARIQLWNIFCGYVFRAYTSEHHTLIEATDAIEIIFHFTEYPATTGGIYKSKSKVDVTRDASARS